MFTFSGPAYSSNSHSHYIYDIEIRNVVFAFCMNQKAGVGLEGAVAASGLAIKNTRSLVGRR